jgi:MFS family permease
MLGAFLVEHVTWSLVFWINLPIGAVTFLMFGLFRQGRGPQWMPIPFMKTSGRYPPTSPCPDPTLCKPIWGPQFNAD